MKTRDGFVSNSSSSSFLIIAKECEFEEWYLSLNSAQAMFVDENMCFKDMDVFGVNAKVFVDEIDWKDEHFFPKALGKELSSLGIKTRYVSDRSGTGFYVNTCDFINRMKLPDSWVFKCEHV
jgi:hypothetical protein